MKKKEHPQAETGREELRQGSEKTEPDKAAVLPPVSIYEKQSREKEDENFETVAYDVTAPDLKPQEEETAEMVPESRSGESDPVQLFPSGGIVVGMEKHGHKEKTVLHRGRHPHLDHRRDPFRKNTVSCGTVHLFPCTIWGKVLWSAIQKAELFDYTSVFLKSWGYEVICLDFKNPEKSTRYNLLQPVIDAVKEKDMERAEMYAWDITNILVGDNTSNEKILGEWREIHHSGGNPLRGGRQYQAAGVPEPHQRLLVYCGDEQIRGRKITHERIHEEAPQQPSGAGADVDCGGGAQSDKGQL